MDRKKIIYAILKELNEGNKNFNYDDFDIEKEIYYDIIKAIEFDELAHGFQYKSYDNITKVISKRAFICVRGIEFLESNSKWGKAYAGLKEFKSWIPGLN